MKTHCERCRDLAAEDANHYFWECSSVALIWWWICYMLQATSSQLEESVPLTMSQALMGGPLEDSESVPQKWWEAAIWIWYIWLARNEETR